MRGVFGVLGIGTLVAGGLAALIAAILIGPLIFWVAWNVLTPRRPLVVPRGC
jgi:hypothetical protein